MKQQNYKKHTRYTKTISLLNILQSMYNLTLHNKINPNFIAYTFLDDKRLFFQLV